MRSTLACNTTQEILSTDRHQAAEWLYQVSSGSSKDDFYLPTPAGDAHQHQAPFPVFTGKTRTPIGHVQHLSPPSPAPWVLPQAQSWTSTSQWQSLSELTSAPITTNTQTTGPIPGSTMLESTLPYPMIDAEPWAWNLDCEALDTAHVSTPELWPAFTALSSTHECHTCHLVLGDIFVLRYGVRTLQVSMLADPS